MEKDKGEEDQSAKRRGRIGKERRKERRKRKEG